jgi:hypothetical protein
MCCKWLSKDDRGALHGSNAEGARDWESSRVRKDTKVYPSVSGDFERLSAVVGSSVVGSDRLWKLAAYLIYFGVDKDTSMDKEYTGIDKISMWICGQCASFATQAVRTIGCDWLAMRVSSFPDVRQKRSSTGAIACASSWSWSS